MIKNSDSRRGMAYLISIAVEFLVPILTLPVFMLVLKPADYGIMALAQVYALLTVGMANLGFNISYDRNYFQYEKNASDSAKLFYTTVIFVATTSFLCGILTLIFREPLAALMRIRGWGNLLVLVFFAEAANSLMQYYLIRLRNAEQAREYMTVDIFGNVLSAVLSLCFVFFAGTGIIGFVTGKLAANIAVLVLMQARVSRVFVFGLDKTIFLRTLKFTLPMTPRLIFGVMSSQFDKFLLGILSNLDGVGIYNIAQKIAYGIFAFMVSTQNVFIPRVYKMMFSAEKDAGRRIGEYAMPFAYLCVGAAMVIGFFAEEFVRILTPKSFQGMSAVILVLALFYALQFIGRIASMQILFAQKTFLITVLTGISLLANFAISVPLIFRWGALGAAWGALGAGLVSVGLSFYLGQRYFRIEWGKFRGEVIYGYYFAATILLYALKLTATPYAFILTVKILFVAVYCNFGLRWGWINADLFRSLWGNSERPARENAA